MQEGEQSYTLDESLLDGSKSLSEERMSPRHPIIIPKLPIGKLATERLRELPRTRSQRLHLQEDEEVRQQARSLLMQGRLGSIRFLNPGKQQLYGGRLQSQPAEPFPELNSSRSRMAEQPDQNVQQQLKIRVIECEGLRAQMMLQQAKHQTELLLRDRRIKRLQQQVEELQERLKQVEQHSSSQPLQASSNSERTLTHMPSSKSLRRFEKIELRSEESILHPQSSLQAEAIEIEQRISKLKEIELQERKTAQSLFRIVGRIKGESDDHPSRNSNLLAMRPESCEREIQTQASATSFRQFSVGTDNIESPSREELLRTISSLEQDNLQIKIDLNHRCQLQEDLQVQLANLKQSLSSAHDSLLRKNIELEQDRSRLASCLVERQLEIEQLRLALTDIEQASTQPHSIEEVPLSKQVEFLEYQNFTLKTRIEQLSEICRNLERQLGEEKLSLEKKISNLYNILEKMEIVAIENEQERAKLETRLLELGDVQHEEARRTYQHQYQSSIIHCLQLESENAVSSLQQELVGAAPSNPAQANEVVALKVRVSEQEEEIEEMCGCINELEKDLLSKQRELAQYRPRKNERGTDSLRDEFDRLRIHCQQLELRLINQQQQKATELQTTFVLEQQHLNRIAELEALTSNLNNDLVASENYRADLQRTCQQFNVSLETLKDTNEKLYSEATLLAQQKNDLEEKLVKLLARRLEKKNSNTQPIEEMDNEQPSQREPEYHRLTRELKTFVRQMSRLCDQLLNDLQTREVVADMNRVNELLQAKLIELNFSPEFKKSMWDSLEIRNEKNDPEEQLKMRDNVNFIEQFLEKSEERNTFCQLIEKRVEMAVGLESQLAVLLNRFLQQLFHHPNHEYLFDRVDHLLQEINDYEQHIDNKFKILEKSIGQYLQQAHAVFQIEEQENGVTEGQCRSQHQPRSTRPFIGGFNTEGRQKKDEVDAQPQNDQQLVLDGAIPSSTISTDLVRSNNAPCTDTPIPESEEPGDIAQIAHSLKLELLKQANTRIRQQRKKTADEQRRQQHDKPPTRRQSSIK